MGRKLYCWIAAGALCCLLGAPAWAEDGRLQRIVGFFGPFPELE